VETPDEGAARIRRRAHIDHDDWLQVSDIFETPRALRAAREGRVHLLIDVLGHGAVRRGVAALAARPLGLLDPLAPAKRRSLSLGSAASLLQFPLEPVELRLEGPDLSAKPIAHSTGRRFLPGRALGAELPFELPDLTVKPIALVRGLLGPLARRSLPAMESIPLGHRLLAGQAFRAPLAAEVADARAEAPQPVCHRRQGATNHAAQAASRSRRRFASHAVIMSNRPIRTTFLRAAGDQPAVSITSTPEVRS
jgi:hypothetical protein